MLPHGRSFAVDSIALARDADVLAREAARYDVHQTTPWLSIECLHIVPDWEGVEASIVLPCGKASPCMVVPFDGAHGAESAEESTEYAAASACE
jgi:hypothetical protein